jgi:hypothetical protein
MSFIASIRRCLFGFIGAMALSTVVQAQGVLVPESEEAIKAAIIQHKADIVAADSTKDVTTAIRLRMALAELSKPKEAQMLYEEAVHLSDSTGRTEDELLARNGLARTLATRGQLKQAYEEALRIADKGAAWMAQQAEVSGSRADEITRAAGAQRDSLLTVMEEIRRNAQARTVDAEENAEFWMFFAVGILVLALVAMVLMVVMNGRTLRHQRAEVAALREELRALTDRSQNRVREHVPPPSAAPSSVAPAVAPVVAPIPPPVVIDPLVVAMFRKQAPERLTTMRDARVRGDHEKVQRVVHTLKPQLVHFDPALAQLCARLTTPQAHSDVQRWNNDLDAFEAAVARSLA